MKTLILLLTVSIAAAQAKKDICILYSRDLVKTVKSSDRELSVERFAMAIFEVFPKYTFSLDRTGTLQTTIKLSGAQGSRQLVFIYLNDKHNNEPVLIKKPDASNILDYDDIRNKASETNLREVLGKVDVIYMVDKDAGDAAHFIGKKVSLEPTGSRL